MNEENMNEEEAASKNWDEHNKRILSENPTMQEYFESWSTPIGMSIMHQKVRSMTPEETINFLSLHYFPKNENEKS
jgi:hypothetical protein